MAAAQVSGMYKGVGYLRADDRAARSAMDFDAHVALRIVFDAKLAGAMRAASILQSPRSPRYQLPPPLITTGDVSGNPVTT